MPIYDQKISKNTRIGRHKPIDYFEPDTCKTCRVLHFGHGDILVSNGSQINEDKTDLLIFQQTKPHEIGIFDTDDSRTGASVVPPVKMYFEKVESIDVVIEQLQLLKKRFLESETQ
jgi:hypothetical protein